MHSATILHRWIRSASISSIHTGDGRLNPEWRDEIYLEF